MDKNARSLRTTSLSETVRSLAPCRDQCRMEISTDRTAIGGHRQEPREPVLADRLLAGAPSRGGGAGKRGLVASLAIHALLVAGVIALPARVPPNSEAPLRVDVVFYTEPAPPIEPVPVPAEPEPEIDSRTAPAPVDPPPAIARLAIASAGRAPLRPGPQLPTPVPPVAESSLRPPEPEPAVRSGVFESERAMPPAIAEPRPRHEARPNVFAKAGGRATPTTHPDAKRAVARTGAFASDRRTGHRDRPGPVILATTEVGGFEPLSPSPASPTPSAPPRSQRAVVDSGFGGERASDGPPEARSPGGAVKQGEFGDAFVVAAPQRERPQPAVDPDVPVEIVSKPRPVYTEQARRLGVQGEVVLEVLFGASGRLRVIRVLQSLGHGLDDAAAEAARRIDFKPALRNGRPIDYTATLRVVFQLA